MYIIRRKQKINKITKEYINIQGDILNKTLLSPLLNSNSITYRVLWVSTTVIALLLCIYQLWDRLVYYSSKPIRVYADMKEETQAYYPAICIQSRYTDEFMAYSLENEDKFEKCREFYLDNKTTFQKIMDIQNFTKMVQNINFIKGNKHLKTNFEITEMYQIGGITTIITNINQKLPIGPDSRIRIKIQSHIKRNTSVIPIKVRFQAKVNKQSLFQTTRYHLAHLFQQNELAIIVKKYNFLDRKQSPCSDVSAVEHCIRKCLLKEIEKMNFTCQLPYLSQKQTNKCIANELTCSYIKMLEQFRRQGTPLETCKCKRECTKEVVTSHYYFNNYLTNTTSYYFLNNWMLSLTEYFSYDFIALMCDIGGFLSLYVGMSCLSLIESNVCLKKAFDIFLFYSKKRSKRNKYILKRIRKIWNITAATKLANQTNKINYKIAKNVKLAAILLTIIVYCYVIYLRVAFYLEKPIFVTITITQDKHVKIPDVALCSNNRRFIIAKKKIMKYKNLNVTCEEDVDMLELLDEKAKYAHNVTALWEASSDMQNYDVFDKLSKSMKTVQYPNLTSINTVHGKCIKVESGDEKVSLLDVFYLSTGLNCNSHTRIFLMKNKERINLQIYEIQPHNSLMLMTFNRQTIKRLNTTKKPCTSLEESSKCEEMCLRSKLVKENLKCRLPFINITHIPLCKTVAEAKKTRTSYLKIYSNYEIVRDCNCYLPCSQTIIVQFTRYYQSLSMPILNNLMVTELEMESNVREIFTEELALPFIKLICDIGSILGFFLGVSVLSCFDILQSLINILRQKIL